MYEDYVYTIYEAPKAKKVIAVSTYAGKTVRGVAKCATNDTYNYEKGADLAAARCGLKIAMKREARAEKKYEEALKTMREAEAYCEKMERYYNDAQDGVVEAQEYLDSVLKDM